MRGLRLLCYSFAVLFVFFNLLSTRPVLAEETIKLAYTDPFSGPVRLGRRRVPENLPIYHRTEKRHGRRARAEVSS